MKLNNNKFNKTDFLHIREKMNNHYLHNNEKYMLENNKIEYISYLLTFSNRQPIQNDKNKLKRIPSIIRDFIINNLFIN